MLFRYAVVTRIVIRGDLAKFTCQKFHVSLDSEQHNSVESNPTLAYVGPGVAAPSPTQI